MVDAERLHRLLRRITDGLARLQTYANAEGGSLLADEVRLGHLKYLFITTIEGCIDAAQHVCASEGYGPPDSNADAVRTLARHGKVDAVPAERVARAVSFRNVLVHGYADVDDRRVLGHLGDLGDLAAYVDALATLVDPDPPEPVAT